MLLIIDNYDSFTYNLVQYFQVLKEDVVVLRNDQVSIAEIEKLNPSGIVISPGPGRPENAGISVEIVNKFIGKIPVLGIMPVKKIGNKEFDPGNKETISLIKEYADVLYLYSGM